VVEALFPPFVVRVCLQALVPLLAQQDLAVLPAVRQVLAAVRLGASVQLPVELVQHFVTAAQHVKR
jgi:hypothetical protein